MTPIARARVLVLATNGFEQSELEKPRDMLREHGAEVHVATPDGNAIRGWSGDDWGDTVEADLAMEDVKADQYDALVLPGGQINPDLLRVDPVALAIVKAMYEAGKICAAICHAPWILVEIGGLSGREATSFKSIKTDVVNAGGRWLDMPVVCDGGIITSRSPDDIEAFVEKIVEQIEHGQRHRRAA